MGANTVEAALPGNIQDVTDRLTVSFTNLLTASVVRDVVRGCYEPLSDARITTYVPLLVEHNSRSKLRRLIRRAEPAPSLHEGPGRASGRLISRTLLSTRST